MSGSEDDAIAPTVAGPTVASLEGRESRELDRFVIGSAIGRYQLKARLGAGAMGVVWLAWDPQLDRDVAIKLVHPDLASEESSSRLLREARAMAKLSHRAVITVHDAGEVDGTLFLAMELVRGTTLGQMLRKRTPQEVAEWKRWLNMLLDAGRGLAEAHRNGVLHRDFKPDNVLVDGSGRVCVGDFGLAALGDRVPARASTPIVMPEHSNTPLDLTSTGQLLGTPVYMSPQQLSGEAIDARADQFSFCVALYEALYGKRPFSSETSGMTAIYSLIAQIIKGPPAPPSDSTVPAPVFDVVKRGLAVKANDRWPDIDALITALEQAMRGKAAMTGAMSRRRRVPVVPIAIAAVALAAGIAIYLVTRSGDRGAPLPQVGEAGAPRKLFGMALRTRMSVSADGTKIAIGGDALWVRKTDGSKEWKAELPMDANSVIHLELDDKDVVFSLEGTSHRWRWHYAGDNSIAVDTKTVGGLWVGTTAAGDLVVTNNRTLSLVEPGKAPELLTTDTQVVAISPDRKRVAYVEGGRFVGTLAVYDVFTKKTIHSAQLDEPVSVVWLDDRTLIFATSTLQDPRIQRVPVDAGAFGEATTIYGAETGWFSDLGIGGGKLFYVSMPPEPTGRVVELATTSRDDLGSVSLGVGWDAAGDLVLWNRGMHDIERQTYPKSQLRPTTGKLAVEPANATLNGDTMIATLRRPGGRQAVAISLVTSSDKPIWEHPDKHTLAVRCAADRAPPCFALRNLREDLDRVVTIDPATGTLGTETLYEQDRIEDIAVSADGKKVLIVGRGQLLRELDPATRASTTTEPHYADGKPLAMSMVRSAAYAPDGSIFIAGTTGRNRYQVGRVVGGVYTRLDELRDGLVAFVRPSPDGSRVVFVARRYSPTLYELPL